jgi:Spy/CpxP family protein refolding chaperone
MSRRLAANRPIMVFALFLLAALTAPAMAQQQPAPGGGGAGGPGGFGGGRMDPAQFRQMMNDRMKELMGANDEEWKALQPRIEKVQQLSRDASNFGGMGLLMDFGQGGGGRGRGFGGQGGPGGDRQPSAAQQKNTELVEVVKNKTSSPEQLKEKLAAARAARAQAKAELAKAQEELRELLTVRQEAVLTAIGTLD